MLRLFRVPVPAGVLVVLSADVALLFASYIAALLLFFGAAGSVFLLFEGGFACVSVVVAGFVLAMYYQDMYSQLGTRAGALLSRLSTSAGAAFIVGGLVAYVDTNLRLPLRTMLLGGIGSIATLFVWRVLYSGYLSRLIGVQSLLFVGSNPIVRQITAHLRESGDKAIRVAGFVGTEEPGSTQEIGPCLGPFERIGDVARTLRPDRIVIGMTERRARLPVAQLLDLRFEGFVIEEAAALYESVCGRVAITALHPSALIFSGELGPRPRKVFWHNALSFGIALVAAVIFSPLMVIIAAAIKLTSPGPVFFRQKRVGLNGELFDVLKFRSMYEDPPADSEELWDTDRDPRVTPIGRILRKSRLNELPQLFDVLKGRMAIVGPRPERPEYVKVFSEKIPFYRLRHSVLPGITGWAQVNYGHADSVEDTAVKLEYDLYYIKYLSLSIDLYIMWHTFKIVLLRRGAG